MSVSTMKRSTRRQMRSAVRTLIILLLTIAALILWQAGVDRLWSSPDHGGNTVPVHKSEHRPPIVVAKIKLVNNLNPHYGMPATYYPPKWKKGAYHKSTGLPPIYKYLDHVGKNMKSAMPYWTKHRMTIRNCMISKWNNPGVCFTERFTPKSKRVYSATSKIYVKCGGSAVIGFVGASQAKAKNIKAGWWGAGAGAGSCLWSNTWSKWH